MNHFLEYLFVYIVIFSFIFPIVPYGKILGKILRASNSEVNSPIWLTFELI